jgi:polyhydroxybutyrate depolymerase
VRSWAVSALAGCILWLATAKGVAAATSPGCGQPPPVSPPATFQVTGTERQAIVDVPPAYRADQPHRLVFAFHGRTNDNADVRRYFDLDEAGSEETIFVYPAGLPDATGQYTWTDPGNPASELRDFALFDVILDRLVGTYCIDPAAIFVTGHSLGATFANSLACARAGRIRGLASVAGGIHGPGTCESSVAALLVHNPDDRAVPLSEGLRARDVLLRKAKDSALPMNLSLGGFACQRYRAAGEPVLWCLHDEDNTARGTFYPHKWPEGAGPTIMQFFASLLLVQQKVTDNTIWQ